MGETPIISLENLATIVNSSGADADLASSMEDALLAQLGHLQSRGQPLSEDQQNLIRILIERRGNDNVMSAMRVGVEKAEGLPM